MKKQLIVCHDIRGKKYKVRSDELSFRPSIASALKREVWEETGLKVSPQALISIKEDFFINVALKRKAHSILIYYICTNPKGKISAKNLTETEKAHFGQGEALWVDLKEIKKLKFYNGVDSVALIRAALKMR